MDPYRDIEPEIEAELAGNENPWQEPVPLADELPPVETFNEALIPECFRPHVIDTAERMQVPLDYPAAALVISLAGCVSRRATIQPKQHDTGWVVVPNLWGGIVAPPGFLKSPVIQQIIKPLLRIENELYEDFSQDQTAYGRAREEHELRLQAWKEEYKRVTKKGNAAPERPPEMSTVPTLRRLVVNDSTFEALHQTMSENPAGIIVIRDELTGWWSTLDRQGREGERAFCLQCWNGDTGHTIDRIGRGSIRVEACCMSLLGGIQPARLRSYLVDALQDGPSNDGLIQRFQILVWPDPPKRWRLVDRSPNLEAEAQTEKVFRRILDLSPESPRRYSFNVQAQALFFAWLTDLENKIRSDDLHPAMTAHFSKYRSLMPSLAMLFQIAEDTAADLESPDPSVNLEHARQAAAWCDYLESHARRIYSSLTTPQIRAARELASKIKKRQAGTEGWLTARDVYLKGWSGLDTPELVKAAADILEDAGWLVQQTEKSGPQGGRPSLRYLINPRVHRSRSNGEK
jgi:putative DNA primase/helicase